MRISRGRKLKKMMSHFDKIKINEKGEIMIKLGSKIKDMITGFEGVAIARIVYLNGCVQIQVQSKKLKDGKIIKAEWIDEPQLICKDKTKDKKDDPGGSGDVPSGLSHPED